MGKNQKSYHIKECTYKIQEYLKVHNCFNMLTAGEV